MFEKKRFFNEKEEIRNLSEFHLKELKKGVPPHLNIEQIWNDYRMNSIVDKVSFHNLLRKLEEIEKKIQYNKIFKFLKKIKDEGKCSNHFSRYLDRQVRLFYHIINEILGNDYTNIEKRKFLVDLLVRYDLILSKKRVQFFDKKQYYLIPFLFPEVKPSKMFLENGKYSIEELERNEEWK